MDWQKIEDLWRSTIAEIPSLFGRLVYLASLRDENKGFYHHAALEEQCDAEHCDLLLAQSHRAVFYDWLALGLPEQCADLREYLQSLHGLPSVILNTWKKAEPFSRYLPETYGAGDRELFLTDLRTLIDLLLVSS